MYSWVSMLSYGWAVCQEGTRTAEKPRELANLELGQGILAAWMDKLATWVRSHERHSTYATPQQLETA